MSINEISPKEIRLQDVIGKAINEIPVSIHLAYGNGFVIPDKTKELIREQLAADVRTWLWQKEP